MAKDLSNRIFNRKSFFYLHIRKDFGIWKRYGNQKSSSAANTSIIQAFFWKKVHNIIRQNKKSAFQEFLFGSQESIASTEIQNDLKDKIANLENQVNFLQQKVIQLESNLYNSKDLLSEASQPLESSKIDQQYNYTLEGKKAPYLTENDPKRSSAVLSEIKDSTSRGKDIESKSLSDASKSYFKALSDSQQYNISYDQSKAQNQSNFIPLGKISEQEKIEIIQLGFQLQNQGKISLKKYYESTQQHSLFQLKGYSIKYESIRRTKLYQQCKL